MMCRAEDQKLYQDQVRTPRKMNLMMGIVSQESSDEVKDALLNGG